MGDLAAIVFPVFAMMAIGWGLGRFDLVGEHAGQGLSDFVFACAIPALIFRTMATAPLPDAQPWGYWLAYFCALALVWAFAMAAARRFFARSYGESVVAGFSAAQANTALIGIPLLLRAYGDAGAVPLFLLIAVHLPITMTVATLLIEGADGFRPGVLARRLALHPILLALFAGLAFRATGLPLTGPPRSLVDALAAASTPCALVAMGLGLRRAGFGSEAGLTWLIVILKLLVHPALVWVFAFRVFAMPPVWSGVAVLFAAMPSGVNAYLFAERYKVGVALSSSAIATTTALSLFSVLFWLAVLGVAR